VQQKNWNEVIESNLKSRFPKANFLPVKSELLGGMLLLTFVESGLFSHVSQIKTARAGTGGIINGSNKGAVAVQFQLFDAKFTFVNCHLTPFSSGLAKRNYEYVDLTKRLLLISPGSTQQISSIFNTK
jgi:hypothetical protein